MLQWMGGSRRMMKQTRKSLQTRQRKFFEQRRQQYRENEALSRSNPCQENHNKQSLDIVGLTRLRQAVPPSVAANNKDSSLRIPEADVIKDGNLWEAGPIPARIEVGTQWTPASAAAAAAARIGTSDRPYIVEDTLKQNDDNLGPNIKKQMKETLIQKFEAKTRPNEQKRTNRVTHPEESMPHYKACHSERLMLLDMIDDGNRTGDIMNQSPSEVYAAFAVEGTGFVGKRTPNATSKMFNSPGLQLHKTCKHPVLTKSGLGSPSVEEEAPACKRRRNFMFADNKTYFEEVDKSDCRFGARYEDISFFSPMADKRDDPLSDIPCDLPQFCTATDHMNTIRENKPSMLSPVSDEFFKEIFTKSNHVATLDRQSIREAESCWLELDGHDWKDAIGRREEILLTAKQASSATTCSSVDSYFGVTQSGIPCSPTSPLPRFDEFQTETECYIPRTKAQKSGFEHFFPPDIAEIPAESFCFTQDSPRSKEIQFMVVGILENSTECLSKDPFDVKEFDPCHLIDDGGKDDVAAQWFNMPLKGKNMLHDQGSSSCFINDQMEKQKQDIDFCVENVCHLETERLPGDKYFSTSPSRTTPKFISSTSREQYDFTEKQKDGGEWLEGVMEDFRWDKLFMPASKSTLTFTSLEHDNWEIFDHIEKGANLNTSKGVSYPINVLNQDGDVKLAGPYLEREIDDRDCQSCSKAASKDDDAIKDVLMRVKRPTPETSWNPFVNYIARTEGAASSCDETPRETTRALQDDAITKNRDSTDNEKAFYVKESKAKNLSESAETILHLLGIERPSINDHDNGVVEGLMSPEIRPRSPVSVSMNRHVNICNASDLEELQVHSGLPMIQAGPSQICHDEHPLCDKNATMKISKGIGSNKNRGSRVSNGNADNTGEKVSFDDPHTCEKNSKPTRVSGRTERNNSSMLSTSSNMDGENVEGKPEDDHTPRTCILESCLGPEMVFTVSKSPQGCNSKILKPNLPAMEQEHHASGSGRYDISQAVLDTQKPVLSQQLNAGGSAFKPDNKVQDLGIAEQLKKAPCPQRSKRENHQILRSVSGVNSCQHCCYNSEYVAMLENYITELRCINKALQL